MRGGRVQDLTIPICFTGLDNDSDALAFVAERYRCNIQAPETALLTSTNVKL